ncbi:hypothetical protein [Nostoc sp.]|uniref:hypothetical protein n=1 Tax=Nostoc sp. TaxID=1180 RepID=UPI002FF4D6A0
MSVVSYQWRSLLNVEYKLKSTRFPYKAKYNSAIKAQKRGKSTNAANKAFKKVRKKRLIIVETAIHRV